LNKNTKKKNDFGKNWFCAQVVITCCVIRCPLMIPSRAHATAVDLCIIIKKSRQQYVTRVSLKIMIFPNFINKDEKNRIPKPHRKKTSIKIGILVNFSIWVQNESNG
jgi:hypothetical protein